MKTLGNLQVAKATFEDLICTTNSILKDGELDLRKADLSNLEEIGEALDTAGVYLSNLLEKLGAL